MEILSITPLTQADLSPTKGRPKGAVGAIRERHHWMAKLVAAGVSDAEIARMVGCSAPTVRNFRLNPASGELIAEYVEQLGEKVSTVLASQVELLNSIGLRIALLLADDVGAAERGEVEISIKDKIKLWEIVCDRTGLGKMETRVNLTGDLGSRMDRAVEAKHRAGEIRAGAFGRSADVIPLKRRV
jgi:hypothetical protein